MKYDYDVVVLGGGAAGLVSAVGSAALGAKTALIEKGKLGGDCTWYGCVPSKTLLKSAYVFSLTGKQKEFGISVVKEGEYDPAGVMGHVREIVKKISTHHPPEMLEEKGIKVFFGSPRFLDGRRIELSGESCISSRRFIICTGSHPLIPPIEGLKDIDYLTNENIFDLEVLPRSMITLGGGPIGVELSLALARLGVETSIVQTSDRILPREDAEASRLLTEKLAKEGIKVFTKSKAVRLQRENNMAAVTMEDDKKKQSVIKAEKLLVATGREASVEGLDLEKAGVKYTNKRIETDASLRTGAGNIYAAGDVTGPYQFSHMAEYQAIIAVGNALFPFKRKVDYRAVPWCTFTDPEVAHLGLTEQEAKERFRHVRVFRFRYRENDRAVTDMEEEGFAKVVCDRKGRILGAHIVGANAGEIIHEYVLAKSAGLSIGRLSSTIHIYPTLAQVVKRTGDQYYTEILKSKWLTLFFKLMLKFLR